MFQFYFSSHTSTAQTLQYVKNSVSAWKSIFDYSELFTSVLELPFNDCDCFIDYNYLLEDIRQIGARTFDLSETQIKGLAV